MSDYMGYHDHSIAASANLEVNYWQPTLKEGFHSHSVNANANLQINYWKLNLIDLGALSYFDWEYAKESGEIYNLHASEWNLLVEFVRVAMPLFGMAPSISNVKINEVVVNSFNAIVAALKRFNLELPLPPTITADNPYIYASYFTLIKNYCNELARINNNGGTLNAHNIRMSANLIINYVGV
ncbi:MAG: hypothetical protein ACYDG2_01235 [Ruminiclostridium sp.]